MKIHRNSRLKSKTQDFKTRNARVFPQISIIFYYFDAIIVLKEHIFNLSSVANISLICVIPRKISEQQACFERKINLEKKK